MSNSLSEVLAAIAQFDSADLTASAGGLQLLPENAEHVVRLEALAHAAASLANSTNKISSPRLRNLLNTTLYQLFGAAEDPPPDCIVEEIPFFGGSYKVFPGAGESSCFIIRNLIAAIFLSPHITDKQFLQDAYDATATILCLSNEIAVRAGLRRGTEPTFTGRDVALPYSNVFQNLKQFVTFTEVELQDLLSKRNVGMNGIAAFVAEGGTDYASSYTVEVGPLHTTPIVRFGTTYVVASPSALLDALAHRLNCLASQQNLQHKYATAYNHAVRASASESHRYLRNEILPSVPSKLDLPPTVTEFFAAPDTDKVVHALVVTDTLEAYDLSGKTRYWNMDALTDLLVERMKEVEQQTHANDPERRILFLLVHQATGRAYGLSFPQFSDRSLFHMVSAADLRTISIVDAGDPLAIWSFAEAAHELRENGVLVQVWNTLDEYGFFREHEYSFYAGDDRLPNIISVHPADFARPLRCKAAHRLDVHAVRHYEADATIEVQSLHGKAEIPIYVPVGPRRGRIAVFLDALEIPVWILGPDQTVNDALYAELADAIAFWLWQAKQVLQGRLRFDSRLRIELAVAEELDPREQERTEPFPAVLIEQAGSSTIKVVFTSRFQDLVRQADNRADRELLKFLMLALIRPNTADCREQEANSLIDVVAPLWLKKKLLSFNASADPALDGRGLPPYRGVRKYQIGKLLDSLGPHLAAIGLPVGSIPDGQRTTVLNNVVAFCYGKLQKVVAALAEEGLLEFVIQQHEAILHRQALGKATIATRLACFGNEPDLLASFQEDLQSEARDAIAVRFLIEYVAATPPSRNLPITLERFDEMLMLGSEITNFGMLSDSVQNKLADLKLSVVPSGRLGIKGDEYREASNQYMEAFAGHEMYVAPRVFRRLTVPIEKDDEPTQMVEELDRAARSEFGYSISDLSSLIGAILRFSDPAQPFCSATKNDIHTAVRDAIGWNDAEITRIMESLILRPRADFLKPDPPFSAPEVYPWRFNRDLSYMRRSFIERKGTDQEEIVWGYRHVYQAHDNLLRLCLSGRLRARTTEMKNFISAVTNRQGSHFNDQVAELFSYPALKVRKRVSKIPETTGLKNVGDLDVLVADPRRKRLDVIECKDLSHARTPHERKLEIENLIGSERVTNPIALRHERRLKWVKQNLQRVLDWLELGNSKGWKVEAYIVVDHPLMAPYLREMPIPVVPYADLESDVLKKYSSTKGRST